MADTPSIDIDELAKPMDFHTLAKRVLEVTADKHLSPEAANYAEFIHSVAMFRLSHGLRTSNAVIVDKNTGGALTPQFDEHGLCTNLPDDVIERTRMVAGIIALGKGPDNNAVTDTQFILDDMSDTNNALDPLRLKYTQRAYDCAIRGKNITTPKE